MYKQTGVLYETIILHVFENISHSYQKQFCYPINGDCECRIVGIFYKKMGKLNVAILRYLSSDDFRVLTAVSEYFFMD